MLWQGAESVANYSDQVLVWFVRAIMLFDSCDSNIHRNMMFLYMFRLYILLLKELYIIC